MHLVHSNYAANGPIRKRADSDADFECLWHLGYAFSRLSAETLHSCLKMYAGIRLQYSVLERPSAPLTLSNLSAGVLINGAQS